ncbi:hypothetical protein FA95DRAFT_1571317 [Auriscalpium vulgare]|uniref:Uncharacterized protein n=1 Tax=Auriscalpium vulgare TaxID=40419 RepID=A0ACB8S072_9AGAM|nr:hypothetical protein FA95DRAFT_1571317 [Auriscalpium vulgare]
MSELPEDLRATYDDVKGDTLYAGSPTLLNSVEWYRDGLVDKLIAKRAAPEDEPVEVEVRLIGQILAEGYWLYACGGYRGPKGALGTWATESPLHKTKASAKLGPATRPAFRGMWNPTMEGLKALMKDARAKAPRPGGNVKYGLLDDAGRVKIRHALFEPIDSDIAANNADLGPQFSIANWPCKFQAGSIALEELKKEGHYTVSPVPAYTKDGKLIPPAEYEMRLRGAVVEVRVAIVREYIFSANSDNFYSDVRAITVLETPGPPVASPGKKRSLAEAPGLKNARQRT